MSMALSQELRKRLVIALTDRFVGKELADAIDAMHVIAPAAHVAPIGATVDLVGVDGVGDNAAPLVGTEARLDAIEAKIDALIASLIAASIVS
jgi:hypothetical protein